MSTCNEGKEEFSVTSKWKLWDFVSSWQSSRNIICNFSGGERAVSVFIFFYLVVILGYIVYHITFGCFYFKERKKHIFSYVCYAAVTENIYFTHLNLCFWSLSTTSHIFITFTYWLFLPISLHVCVIHFGNSLSDLMRCWYLGRHTRGDF